MATSLGSPQTTVKRARGSNKCPKHLGKEVVFYCKTCDELVCADCVIQECQGHVFEGIRNVIAAAAQKLEDFITKVETTEIPSIQGKLEATDSDLIKNKNHFKIHVNKIRKRNEDIKKELDKITETFVKTCRGVEQHNLDELLQYKSDLQTRIEKLTSRLQDVKETLQSRNDILVFDMSHGIHSEFDEDLPKPVCSTQEFTPGKSSLKVLEDLLGELTNRVQNQSLNRPGHWQEMSTFTPYTEHWAKSMQTTREDQAWTSFVNTNTNNTAEKMILTDQTGHVKQTLDMDVRVVDFCLSPETGNIWLCSVQDSSVREVEGNQSLTRFITDTPPWCICVNKDGRVTIGHDQKVVKYTQGGQKVCSTPVGISPDVRSPWHISECPLTSNLAVVDLNMKTEGGNGKPFVSILNDQLQPLYTYTGEGEGQPSLRKPFQPYDAIFTGAGELVITDYNNKSVVLVTGTGRYLATLYTRDISSPRVVSVHSDVIWVSFRDGSIQVLNKV